MPEIRGEGVEPQGEVGQERLPSESGRQKPDSEEEYISTLQKAAKLEEKLTDAIDSARKADEKMKYVRESMGLAPESEVNTSSSDHAQTLEKQRIDLEEEIVKQEQHLLGIPEGEGADSQFLKKHIETLDRQSIKGLEKKARQESVDAFIDSSIKETIEDFRNFLDDSQNAEAAETLIQQKITFLIQKRAENFIENGTDPDFGFEAEIVGMEFEDSTDGKVMYVTEFNITFDHQSALVKPDTYEPKKKLINQEEQEQMNQAQDRGELEEIEKGTV